MEQTPHDQFMDDGREEKGDECGGHLVDFES